MFLHTLDLTTSSAPASASTPASALGCRCGCSILAGLGLVFAADWPAPLLQFFCVTAVLAGAASLVLGPAMSALYVVAAAVYALGPALSICFGLLREASVAGVWLQQ